MGGINEVYSLCELFGKWKFYGEIPQVGDLVYVKSPFVEKGEGWALLIQYKTQYDVEVLMPTSNYTAKVIANVPLEIQLAWSPTMDTSIPGDSPEAAFWGPMLSGLKYFYDNTNSQRNTHPESRRHRFWRGPQQQWYWIPTKG